MVEDFLKNNNNDSANNTNFSLNSNFSNNYTTQILDQAFINGLMYLSDNLIKSIASNICLDRIGIEYVNFAGRYNSNIFIPDDEDVRKIIINKNDFANHIINSIKTEPKYINIINEIVQHLNNLNININIDYVDAVVNNFIKNECFSGAFEEYEIDLEKIFNNDIFNTFLDVYGNAYSTLKGLENILNGYEHISQNFSSSYYITVSLRKYEDVVSFFKTKLDMLILEFIEKLTYISLDLVHQYKLHYKSSTKKEIIKSNVLSEFDGKTVHKFFDYKKLSKQYDHLQEFFEDFDKYVLNIFFNYELVNKKAIEYLEKKLLEIATNKHRIDLFNLYINISHTLNEIVIKTTNNKYENYDVNTASTINSVIRDFGRLLLDSVNGYIINILKHVRMSNKSYFYPILDDEIKNVYTQEIETTKSNRYIHIYIFVNKKVFEEKKIIYTTVTSYENVVRKLLEILKSKIKNVEDSKLIKYIKKILEKHAGCKIVNSYEYDKIGNCYVVNESYKFCIIDLEKLSNKYEKTEEIIKTIDDKIQRYSKEEEKETTQHQYIESEEQLKQKLSDD
ncbi:MAG: hypothetical protein QXW35_05790 [Candidatus Aenigmatarchaeota archaeon]